MLTDEQKTKLQELLADAEPTDIEGWLPAADAVPRSALKGRLSDKDKAAKALQAEYEKRLSALTGEHAAAMEELETLKAKDLTASEKIAAELAKRDNLIAAERKAREAESSRYAAERQARAQDYLEAQLSTQLASGKHKPVNLRHAMLVARDELDISVEDSDGKFSLSVTADGLPVDDPRQAISAWFEQQTHLQTKSGTEMPPPGAGHPPGAPPPNDPLANLEPGAAQLSVALGLGDRH